MRRALQILTRALTLSPWWKPLIGSNRRLERRVRGDRLQKKGTLAGVATEIITVADKLSTKIQKYEPSGKGLKTMALRKTLSYLKNKSDVEKLSRQLDRLQDRMQSEVLIDLRQMLKESEADMTGQLQKLNHDLQNLYRPIVAGQTKLEDLVEQKSGRIKAAITEEAQKMRENATQRA
ncbi:hypothetical protein BU23DRAFT_634184 [Bimuria novae-zelandiae CBS 107.79]|uniref:Uncharacterized protein n=1 Tax=Bimuria novae-zelandiae CBS 107.79 TaxID=1447943 RepID=A0A6A5VPD3_9PLEO|nr:hypothetical protein BU23DRAFT_634184 [Bimuria novae-zelandiae CBS 107.79]